MNNPLKVIHSLAEIPTGYTIFEKDQVLTDRQLNGLTAYLDGQDRSTRIELLGVGIVAGLRPRLAGGKITISKGVGVPTNGDLMVLPDHMSFDRFRPYGGSAPFYGPFCTNGKPIDAFELLREGKKLAPVNECSGNTQPLSSFGKLAEMVVVMLMESCENNHGLCSCSSCDNMGKDAANTMRFLLVSRSDARSLRHHLATYRERALGLPEIFADRPLLTSAITSASDLAKLYYTACESIHNKLTEGFEKLCTIFPGLIRDIPTGSSDPGLILLLNGHWNTFAGSYLPDASNPTNFPSYFQYYYDFLRDLTETWNALREALFNDDSVLCPDMDAFPKHLLLGDLSSPEQSRTGFFPSPLTSCACRAREHALFLLRKLRTLLYTFEVPGMDKNRELAGKSDACCTKCRDGKVEQPADKAGAIIITPSGCGCASLEERAIPYYYSVTGQFPIYRWWNHRLCMRGEELHNLGYRASAYGGAPGEPLNYQTGNHDFFRIEGHLGMDIEAAIKKLSGEIGKYNLPITVLRIRLDGSGRDLKSIHDSLRSEINERLLPRISALKIPENGRPSSPSPSFSFPGLPQNDFLDKWVGYLNEIKDMNSRIDRMKSQGEGKWLFSNFFKEHPGLGHFGGVISGGTFILAHDENGKIVADFMLPYHIQPEPTAQPGSTSAPNPTPEKPDLAVAKPDITVAQPDITIAKPDITIAKPDITIAKPDITIAKPDITITKPDITVAQPDLTVAQPGLTVAQPGLTVAQPGLTVAQPGLTVAQPDLTVAQPDLTVAQPDLTVAQPDITIAKPGLTVAQPDLTVAQPGLTVAQPGLTVAQPGLTVAQPGLTVAQPGLTVAQPGLTVAQPGLTVAQPGLTLAQPGLTVAQPGLTVAQPGLTVAQPGLTVAKPGLTAAKPEFTAAGLKGKRVQSNAGVTEKKKVQGKQARATATLAPPTPAKNGQGHTPPKTVTKKRRPKLRE